MLLSVYAHFVVLDLAIINRKSAHLVWLPRDQWYRRYKIHKDSIFFWSFTVTFTLKTIYFLHKTLQLMMMYHPIKFGCKKISRSKTHKRLKEHFLIGRNKTKSANFRGSPLFQATYNIKTEKQLIQLILCQLDAHPLSI